MIILRSLIFNLAFYGFTLLVAFVCLPSLVLPLDASVRVGKLWGRGSLFLARIICGIAYRVEGRQYLALQPAVFASKHQSAWDTLIFWALVDSPVYVLKKELLNLPLFGLYLRRLGSIAIDRKGQGVALKAMLAQAKTVLENGRSVVIFPEGTRTGVGENSVYHPGVASIYGKLGARVMPVALNSGLYWGKNAFFKRPGIVTIAFLPPIEPGMRPRDFMARLSQTIEAETARLTKK